MGAEPRVCEHCGAVLGEDDQFCGVCGKPAPKTAEPDPAKPAEEALIAACSEVAKPRAKRPNRRLIATVAAGLLVVVALVGSFAFRQKPPKPMTPIDQPEASAESPAPDAEAQPTANPSGEVAPAAADPGLVGIWVDPDAPNKGYIEIRSLGGKLAATTHDEGAEAQPIDIESASGRKITGHLDDAAGEPVPIAMELMEGSGQLMVTTGSTEEDTSTTTLSRVDKPPHKGSGRPQAEVSAPPKSAAEALLMVRARPEVAQFVRDVQLRGREAHIRLVSEDEAGYMVQVFEPMTTASGAPEAKTFGYYMVSKSTGEVKAQF